VCGSRETVAETSGNQGAQGNELSGKRWKDELSNIHMAEGMGREWEKPEDEEKRKTQVKVRRILLNDNKPGSRIYVSRGTAKKRNRQTVASQERE